MLGQLFQLVLSIDAKIKHDIKLDCGMFLVIFNYLRLRVYNFVDPPTPSLRPIELGPIEP